MRRHYTRGASRHTGDDATARSSSVACSALRATLQRQRAQRYYAAHDGAQARRERADERLAMCYACERMHTLDMLRGRCCRAMP